MGFVVTPGRRQYACYKSAQHKQEIIRWLAAHEARDWHAVAQFWNWDGGIDTLALITEQPECDCSTVQLIFSLMAVDDYLVSRERFDEAKADPGSTLSLWLDILARWRNGFYTRRQFAFADDFANDWVNSVLRYQLAVIDHWDRHENLMLPFDFMMLGYGMKVETDYYFKNNLVPESMQP